MNKHCVSIKVIGVKHVQEKKKHIHFIQVQKVTEHIAKKVPSYSRAGKVIKLADRRKDAIWRVVRRSQQSANCQKASGTCGILSRVISSATVASFWSREKGKKKKKIQIYA